MAVSRAAARAPESPEAQVAGFIDKFSPEHQTLIREVRQALQRRLPTANELVYDNYQFLVIGYSSTGRPSDSLVSFAAGASGAALHFYYGASLPDPHKVLLGSGSQNRFVRVDLVATLRRPEVEALIAAAENQADPPLRASGARALIIRSVSARQRPRRKKDAAPSRRARPATIRR
jgi:hypothetical protein